MTLLKEISQYLPAISQYLPAAISTYNTVGAAITLQQQDFVMANWKGLTDFLKTDEGKIALQTFVGDWEAKVNPKPIEKKAPSAMA